MDSTASNDNDCPRFRPFASPTQRMIKVKKAKYSTSLDPRGYIPVYEYLINGQPIMWDRESGYVHFTGIWKSLGNSKADIVKMVDSNPELKVKKIRGGFLKIQGTWIPYEYAYILCKRTAWVVRKDLVAMFGPRFINDALDPTHPEYGCLLLDPSQKGSSLRRNSFTTMRQSGTHPYKRDFMRNSKTAIMRDPKSILPRQQQQQHQQQLQKEKKAISNMSLSRLLNNHQQSDMDSDGEEHMKFTTDSPGTTPSPTFRAVPTFDPKWTEVGTTTSNRLLPPIYTEDAYVKRKSEPRITPVFSPTWSPVSPVTSEVSSSSSSTNTSHTGYAKDVIDTINATILLQRLSQDDGARPFKPMHPDSIPSKVTVGNQEYHICWDN
ncbi:transcription regulator HTH, apses-type DNA-binding domain-containing protein [Mucor mucedo]|uniref:transcription regulator HTH, apses-type DNA-binding domain-containing protein n=1 Tax=Mucor mucedo TaxID=29922 RepID=UPI00221F7AA6|nr:transcription regulator HTH, apses-type DNA-binding domain-containing protein [Mucor mucedo]KAI7894972.1 transcription regulator HTH, apses-type DNA-binding domain-containing protein [Mucor mucedo]